jgi:uncharacterized protein (DUF2267 family)
MNHDEYLGELQHRAELPSQGEADRVARAVLTTLGERLTDGEADDLAAQLPREIDRYLEEADSGQQFAFSEFTDRVADRAETEQSEAAFLSQVGMDVTVDAAGTGELQDVVTQFPQEEGYGDLLSLVGNTEYYN